MKGKLRTGATVFIVVFAGSLCWGDVRVLDLRCEYRVNPRGIDVAGPRLSWVLESNERSQRQSHYRILVASNEEILRSGRGDLWDSGKVVSDRTTQIRYGGKTLESGMVCCWKVRVWGGDYKGSHWSKMAIWSMGLLAPSDWKAAWIGLDSDIVPPEDRKKTKIYRPCPYLRKDFALNKSVKRATVYATALGLYELHINGRRVGADYLTPGWTDYSKRIYYQTYDVTDLIKGKADNTIGAILPDGWYAGNISNLGQAFYGWNLRLRAQLVVRYDDGTEVVIPTDGSWKGATGAILEADMQGGETYDARLEMPGWDKPGFDEAGWKKVDVTESVEAKIEAYPSAPVRRLREIGPARVTQPKRRVFVLDMGTNFAGWVRLKVQGKAGDRVRLRFAERLNPDGTVYTENLRSARATDTYICKGKGTEEWEPGFTYHGFQYVEVTGYPGGVDKTSVTGVEITADTPRTGYFRCSSAQANKLYRNIRQTQRANFIEIPTDCPQRDERMGWTGDAQIYVRTATYNADVSAFMTKWMVDVEDAQYDDGGFGCMAPRPHDFVSPAWADAGVIVPWTMYQVYGDTRIIKRHYDAMTRWIEHCRTNSKDLVRPDQGFGDWLSIKGDTQTVYVLAIAFDLLDDAKAPKAIDYLVADVEKRDWHLSTGFVGTKDLMGALTKAGRLDVAYRLFNNDTFPSWGFSIRHGATSIWERWDGWTPEKGFFKPSMNSFAHYSFGAVAEWMFKTIGGIDTDGPGFKRIIIAPRPGGGIDHADVKYNSIHGEIASRWKLADGVLTLDIDIPANTTAVVRLPAADVAAVTESGKPASKAEGVKFLRMQDNAAVFSVGSGDYHFISRGVKEIRSARTKQ